MAVDRIDLIFDEWFKDQNHPSPRRAFGAGWNAAQAERDAGPQPDEMVRLLKALDATEIQESKIDVPILIVRETD